MDRLSIEDSCKSLSLIFLLVAQKQSRHFIALPCLAINEVRVVKELSYSIHSELICTHFAHFSAANFRPILTVLYFSETFFAIFGSFRPFWNHFLTFLKLSEIAQKMSQNWCKETTVSFRPIWPVLWYFCTLLKPFLPFLALLWFYDCFEALEICPKNEQKLMQRIHCELRNFEKIILFMFPFLVHFLRSTRQMRPSLILIKASRA